MNMIVSSAAVVAATPALSSVVAPSGFNDPDAEIFALAAELESQAATHRVALGEAIELDEIYKTTMPDRPAALRYSPVDNLDVGYDRYSLAGGKLRAFYGMGQIIELKAAPRTRLQFVGTDEQWFLTSLEEMRANPLWADVLDEMAQKRAEEVIAAHDAWEAECDALREACGLTAAEQLEDELGDACDAIYDRMMAIEATTLGGLAVQAAAVKSRDDEFEERRILDDVLRLAASATCRR
jgi:hypothetical protein